MIEFQDIGFSEFFSAQHNSLPSFIPARVVSVERGLYRVISPEGACSAKVSGRFEFVALDADDYPCVGDWVCLRPDDASSPDSLRIIERVMERRTQLRRKKVATHNQAQLIAANIDYVMVVQSCNDDFNPRRLERYLAAIAESGAEPVVVLNKADLDPEHRITYETQYLLRVSAEKDPDLDVFAPYLAQGKTAVLVGSSGVGKSTLTNRLCGTETSVQETQEIREGDSKGRHTTTSREMFLSHYGGVIIDTPGMREFGLMGSDTEATGLFDDIVALMTQCGFGDCQHNGEPDCAVDAALRSNTLEQKRYQSYLKLKREEAFQRSKEDPAIASQQRQARRKRARSIRRASKVKI